MKMIKKIEETPEEERPAVLGAFLKNMLEKFEQGELTGKELVYKVTSLIQFEPDEFEIEFGLKKPSGLESILEKSGVLETSSTEEKIVERAEDEEVEVESKSKDVETSIGDLVEEIRRFVS